MWKFPSLLAPHPTSGTGAGDAGACSLLTPSPTGHPTSPEPHADFVAGSGVMGISVAEPGNC